MADIWRDIEELTKAYQATAGTAINAEQFSLYALTHHSTKIEGSTLTIEETNTLLEKGISIGGKPLEHQNMVLDHYEALQFVLEEAKKKRILSVAFIQEMGAKVMRRTGREISSALGSTDEKKGDLRKVPVTAGGHYFVDAAKVQAMMQSLVNVINEKIDKATTTEDILVLSFAAHFDLVSIHPFTDGNGRTSRLLMNYIQAYHQQPLTLVNAEDKAAYIQAITQSRNEKSTQAIVTFMAAQHMKELTAQINAYKASQQTGGRKLKDEGYSLIF